MRGLVLLLLGAALVKVTLLGWQAVEHWTFVRPRVVESSRAGPPIPVPDPLLQQAVDQAAAGGSGSVAVFVLDLSSGASAARAPDQPFPAASLFKLPLLVEVLKQERLGRVSPQQRLTIKPEHWTDGAGVLQAQVGQSYTVAELTDAMIVHSDNIAARVLLDLVGVESVNQTLAAMGLKQTRLAPLNAGSGSDPPEHVISARDAATLLAVIATGGLVDASTSEQALRLLESKQDHAWLADELPWWAKLAHKWGDLPGARHDAGIVYTPRGRYVIAVLTQNKPPDEAAATIARVSRAAFDRLGADTP